MDAKPRFRIAKDTRTLVFVEGQWEEYWTEEELTFDKGDIGSSHVTFRWARTLIQARKEDVGGEWRE